ncbi:MAG TPA: hypothetical protein VI078_02230 [bacterium]
MTHRVVALGASNLLRGLAAVVAAARDTWGPGVEVLAAGGHGRSYGRRSTFLARGIPGILECGIWDELERLPPAPTRALITDVGNDILYGRSPAQVLAWVGEAVDRLQRHTRDIVATDLPLASIRRLSNVKFLAVRTVLFPASRVTVEQAQEAAAAVDEGMVALAAARGLRLQHLREEWYGFDPIHIRASLWPTAWGEILMGPDADRVPGRSTRREWLRLYRTRPERRWMFGREQVTPQRGTALAGGGVLRMY